MCKHGLCGTLGLILLMIYFVRPPERKQKENIFAAPVSLLHDNAVQGHDLLIAPSVSVDPLGCFCCSGDHAVHVTPELPGDDPRSVVILNNSQVGNLHSKAKGL